ncbi:MAG: hypothetical protein E7294_04735 [Lachnospiraceae bacterium]|jgi:glyoxylase I family protein|nr:hypothetical protein [Lachnospiraceae bacterium]
MILGVHHISFIVSSEKCVEFYKILGFTEFYRKERAYDLIILLEGYGIQLELFVDPRHPKRAEAMDEPLGLRHMAFKVANIECEIERLSNACNLQLDHELQVDKISADWIGERYVFIRDLDGNVVELHE